MRLPFDLNNSGFSEDARIKFIYTSPELHQNIEISIDGDKTSVDTLIDTFERFMGALGICIPKNVVLGFMEVDEEGNEKEDSQINFELEEDDDDDDDDEEKE